MKTNKKKWILMAIPFVVVLLIGTVFLYYGISFARADDQATQCLNAAYSQVTIDESVKGQIAFIPETVKAGLIFYPGGSVDEKAYAPILSALSEEGILCVLVDMPLKLAIMDINAADGIQKQYPYVTEWYIGGHSLGGYAASKYVEKNSESYKGLILLAAYADETLALKNVRVLSIYGSCDGVLNKDRYGKFINACGDITKEVVIEGGCHAYFGNYGIQKGDGEPQISREEQQNAAVTAINNWMDN